MKFQLKEIIDNVPGDVYWKDLNGNWLGMSKRSSQSLKKMGFSFGHDDIIGKNDYDLFDKETATLFRTSDSEVLQRNEEIIKEESATLPNGEKVIQLSIKRPLHDKNNNVVGVIGNTVDITKLKQTESALLVAKEKAEVASKAKTEFISNMSHDIRTPLSGMLGMLDIVLSKIDNSSVIEYLNNFKEATQQLLEFLNQILDMAMIDHEKTIIEQEAIDLHDLLYALSGLIFV